MLVMRRVSARRSNESRSPSRAVMVRQQPFTAILSPSCDCGAREGARRVRRALSPLGVRLTISPVSTTRPVNMGRMLAVWDGKARGIFVFGEQLWTKVGEGLSV